MNPASDFAFPVETGGSTPRNPWRRKGNPDGGRSQGMNDNRGEPASPAF